MIRRPETSVLLLLPYLGAALGCAERHEAAATQRSAEIATTCEAPPDAGGCPGGAVPEGSQCCVYAVATDSTGVALDALEANTKTCTPAPVADAGSPTPTPTDDASALFTADAN